MNNLLRLSLEPVTLAIDLVATPEELNQRANALMDNPDLFEARLQESLALVEWRGKGSQDAVLLPAYSQYMTALAYIALCRPLKRKGVNGVYTLKHLAERWHREGECKERLGYCSQYVFANAALMAGAKVVIEHTRGITTGQPFLKPPRSCRKCRCALPWDHRKYSCGSCLEIVKNQ